MPPPPRALCCFFFHNILIVTEYILSDHDDDQECSDDDEGIDENPISDEQDEDQNDLVGRKMSSDEVRVNPFSYM